VKTIVYRLWIATPWVVAGSGGQKLRMMAWPLRTTQAPMSTATTSATSHSRIVPDEGLAPGRLDMGLLDLMQQGLHAGRRRG
jgi:hypothetical protein